MNLPASDSERARGELGGLKPALAFLRPYGWHIAGALVALIFTAIVTLSIGQGLRFLIDRGFATGSESQLAWALTLFFSLVALLATGTFIRFYLVSWIGERVVADMRKAVFNRVIELHPGFFEENGSAEIQTRLTTDTTLLQTVVGSSVSIALRNLLMFIGGLVWMFFTDAKLASIVVLSVPVVILPILFFGRRVRSLSRSSQDRIADVGTYVGEALGNIKTVQAFNHQPHDRRLFEAVVERAFATAVERVRQRSWLVAVVIVLVLGAVGLMLWVGGQDVLAGRLSAGELVAFIFYAVIVAGSVGAFSEVYGDLQRAAGATERLMELLHTEPLIRAPAQPQVLPGRSQGELAIRNLVFSYPSRPDSRAIDNLSLHIAPGSRVALVGSSGAGKSTLFDLLLRFYQPQSGSILLDGVNIADMAPEELRRHIAIVPQQPRLFTGTVLTNIRYGLPDADEAAVLAAARAAHAHEFIERLPQGYDSFLGEGGVRLSGGQRQRIAIARALLVNPALLLLDEATSALDAESEFLVQQALDEVMVGRTSLVIAHRLATVRNVDRILVLDQGHLIVSGTHEELLSASPLYARWAELQFGAAALAD